MALSPPYLHPDPPGSRITSAGRVVLQLAKLPVGLPFPGLTGPSYVAATAAMRCSGLSGGEGTCRIVVTPDLPTVRDPMLVDDSVCRRLLRRID